MELADPTRRDTRSAILDAAEAVVARMGVGNLTFDEIAREAGVSKGGVLYHFRSKEALTEAMIERFIDRFDMAVADAAASDRNPLGRMARAYVRATIGEPPLTGELFDRANGAITAAMANFPERLRADPGAERPQPSQHRGRRDARRRLRDDHSSCHRRDVARRELQPDALRSFAEGRGRGTADRLDPSRALAFAPLDGGGPDPSTITKARS